MHDKLTLKHLQQATDLMPELGQAFRLARVQMPSVIKNALREGSLAPRHLATINMIALSKRASVGEISKRLSIGVPAASQITTELEQAGWLIRQQDEADKRRFWFMISDDRQALVETFCMNRTAPLLRTLEQIPPEQREEFLAYLGVFADELSK